MRHVTDRRKQLEQEQKQALAILTFKQNELTRLQRAQFVAEKEQEGVVQMLESTLDSMQASVLELEEKCRTQSQQFAWLSHELERFRLQAEDNPDTESYHQLTNGVKEPEFNPYVSGLAKPLWPQGHHRRVLPSIGLKPGCTANASRLRPLFQHKHKPSPPDEVPAARARRTGKPNVFIVRHSYDPYSGPNHSPEDELPLRAGEYICVYGEMDEDGFYEGELMDGRSGLVPSNFVELVSSNDIMGLPQSSAHNLSYNYPQNYLKNQVRSDPQAPEEGVPERVQSLRTNGLEADVGELAADSVPYPWKLSLIKQLTNSIIIGWDPPLAPAGWGNMWSYNIFVDEELRLSLPFGSQTKAILERLDLNLKAYRVCVQSVQTDRGASDRLRCTLLVGRDVCMAPTLLRAERVTATSALLTWLSSNSNFMHTVSLNDEERWLVKPGDYSLALNDLRPRQLYKAQVEARTHHTPWELSLYGRQHRSATVTFTTLALGCLAAPEHVQLEAGPSPGIVLISWLPVGIDAVGRSNGVLVSGYAIYADKKKVLEVSSPKASNALMGSAQIQTLLTAQELTVRTMSPQGESSDSVPVPILPNLRAIAAAMPLSHTSGPAIPAKGPPPDLSAAETSALLHNPPVDAHLVRTSSSVHKATSTDCISSPPLQISLTSSSVAVQTAEAAIGTENVQMKIPTVSVSQFPEHTDSIAEPRPPTGPVPVSFQDVGPKADLHGQAVPLPQNPIPLRPSLLEPDPDGGSPRKSAWVEPVHKSPNQTDLTPKPQNAYCKDSSYMQKHLETQNGCCMSVMGLSSDIILGEDKNLCSVGPGEEPSRGEDSKSEPLEMDSSDEEVLARILRAQVPINKELFSIAEVTEEDDSCQETEEQKLQKSPQIPQKHKSSVSGKPAISSSAASCPTIPNCPTHCSAIASSHTHPAKSSEEPIYRLLSLDSTAHCATALNSPTHGPHVSGDPVCGSLDPYSSAHCSLKSKCPTTQSKSPDIPVYQPPTRHTHWSEVAFNPSQSLISDGPNQYATSMTNCSSCTLSSDGHFDTRSQSNQHVTTGPGRKNPNVAHDHSGYLTIPQPRSKPKHRVHYSDIVDTITYQKDEYDSDSSIYISSKEARRQRRKSHKPLHQRGLPERGGDRLRREALLRSQRASDNPPLVQYLDSKALVRTRVPVTSGIEIDVEYGTEDDEASLSYGATGVVVEEMSSEWWVEGGSPSIFEALRPDGQQSPRVLPFEMEAPNPRYCHTSRGASLGTRQRGPSGVGDLAEWRQDCHTSSTCAKPDHKARSYSSGDPRSLYGQSTPLRTTSGKTRAKASQLKDADGVRLASPECVEPERPPCQDGARIFVALFSYDPSIMSPNPDTAEEELHFKEGQIIKVYGDKDQDGFYYGKSGGRSGFVPSNMVSEIQVEDELTKAQLLQKGFLSPESSMANRDLSKPDSQPQEMIPRRMKAIFDYDPQKNSPNDDMEVELSFHAGDVISVYGNVDEDGFFYGELNGRRGLVPSNFLKTLASLGDQATPGPEQPEHQHEMPRLKQHSQLHCHHPVNKDHLARHHYPETMVKWSRSLTKRLLHVLLPLVKLGPVAIPMVQRYQQDESHYLHLTRTGPEQKNADCHDVPYQASSATSVFKGDHKPQNPLPKMHPFWALPNEILRSLS